MGAPFCAASSFGDTQDEWRLLIAIIAIILRFKFVAFDKQE